MAFPSGLVLRSHLLAEQPFIHPSEVIQPNSHHSTGEDITAGYSGLWKREFRHWRKSCSVIFRAYWLQLLCTITLTVTTLSMSSTHCVSTDKREIVPVFSNKRIYYLWQNKWEFFSLNSSSTGALGSCITVLFLIISIWLSVSAFFPGFSRATWSSGPRWTKRSAGKILLQACLVYTPCSKPTNGSNT